MMSAVNVRDSRESHGARAARARLELVRLINLTHVLVCIMADSANKVYAKSSIERYVVPLTATCLTSTSCVLCHESFSYFTGIVMTEHVYINAAMPGFHCLCCRFELGRECRYSGRNVSLLNQT